MDDLFLH